MVFIEGMKAKNCSAAGKSGVHRGNESQKELGCKKKWCSTKECAQAHHKIHTKSYELFKVTKSGFLFLDISSLPALFNF
jgi:hypothetical protein